MIPYRPEPLTDFHNPANQEAFAAALAKVERELGRTYPLIIGGKRIDTGRYIESINPSKKTEVIGRVAMAGKDEIEQALEAAWEAYRTWSRMPVIERAALLFKTAAIIRRRKHEFSAWMLLEAGKSRAEADADTAEAIDFLEYYGRQMIDLARRADDLLTPISGEDNHIEYIPLGVGAIIPPWNFPLAIVTGMTVSAVVAGNTVLLKPAIQTPVIAYKLMEALEEAGMPPGVVNFVPGDPAEMGDFMVGHKDVRFISFTGSKQVGLHLNELAAKRIPGQRWIKRFIAEMGGKDAIVVDEGYDVQAAAQIIAQSAFGFSGQKCSACSRVIAHESLYDELVDRVAEIAKAFKVGDVRDASVGTGPVIDQKAFEKVTTYIEIGRGEGRLVAGGTASNETGFFIHPTVFADVKPDARIMQEEIFGPVVAFTKVKSFEEAIDVANSTEFGLTGSVLSTNREHLAYARHHFHVGNLYFNRKCTGAVVGVHPFGGFNMSGTDSKAGGPDYLLLFTQMKSVSELL
ncbi:L-glutamate gamma-semialdehyde dehydrogenase [Alicyclobacillus acidocaldarius]|uniref:L-glutamate gamma-semialdehyde dehydrogenase n=1 Tax=Alicyclobacillus acidocaldarius subsp. acidocaldarius (strain ATCC 27009 / DSM 446 / BCRC 14685 / JCM 5260 / KCTC 1825 / NBRC 15652 / NCIMB 11725 / NRRL B-14509 / 104-IA) TaxID=521098 RepID=C8WRH7_ALIAD|nr:L-glutamate gamma-semialdehyde dehydrogenase [Alicyclobacillus acidocaldarius]ACV57382.1 delta-1-pyrroline-5-carboxylate dehydrogenase [Alicyclobacillus acidocaldarius subsp. acidocaldarius DSM 446]